MPGTCPRPEPEALDTPGKTSNNFRVGRERAQGLNQKPRMPQEKHLKNLGGAGNVPKAEPEASDAAGKQNLRFLGGPGTCPRPEPEASDTPGETSKSFRGCRERAQGLNQKPWTPEEKL